MELKLKEKERKGIQLAGIRESNKKRDPSDLLTANNCGFGEKLHLKLCSDRRISIWRWDITTMDGYVLLPCTCVVSCEPLESSLVRDLV